MIHVATILDTSGYAYAVYSDAPIPEADVLAEFTASECGRLLIPTRFRLVLVGEEPAPSRLPADLSESVHGG